MKAGKLHHANGMITTSICGSQNTLVVRVRPSVHFHTLIVTHFGGQRLSLLYTSPDMPWGPPSLLYKGYRSSFPGVKRVGRGVYHPLPSSTEVKNEGRCTPTSPLCLHGMLQSDLYLCLCYGCFGHFVDMFKMVRADSKEIITGMHLCNWRVFRNTKCQLNPNIGH
jgi:hypothetical protein